MFALELGASRPREIRSHEFSGGAPKPKAPPELPTGPVRIELTGTNLCLGNKGDALSHLVSCTSNEADGFELKTSEAGITKLTFQNKCLTGCYGTLSLVDCENVETLEWTTPNFGLTCWGGPMCMTVVGKDLHAGLSVEALGCDGDAANPHNNDWTILA